MKYDILVNKNNPISKEYKVNNLVSVGKHFSLANLKYTDQDVLLEKDTVSNLVKLLNEINKLNKNITIIPNSGYRSYEYQEKVMNYYIKLEGLEKAKRRVAEPGTSEHHTGLAIDLTILKDGKLLQDIKEASKMTDLLYKTAHNYGFILRYPKGKEEITGFPNEIWHFRYVGKDLATYLYQNNLTLEEYYLYNLNN